MKEIQEVLKTAIPKNSQKDGKKSSVAETPEERFYKAWEEDKAERKRIEAERIKNASNMAKRFRRRTFDTFDQSRNKDAYDKAVWYSDHYDDTEKNSLILAGTVGTGKTHLVASITNKLLENGVPVLFDTFSGHLYKLKAEFGTSQNYLHRMQKIDMLVIDDVGKEKQTDWTRSIMFDVINYRYENLLPIVMTTNYDSKELAEYFGSAIWSRLCEMCTGVKMEGSDYRK